MHKTQKHTQTLATSFASRVLNQQDYLDYVHCAALRAKSPGITGTSTNLPVTLFNSHLGGSQQRHHTVSLCSNATACIKHAAFKRVFKSRIWNSFRGGGFSSQPM